MNTLKRKEAITMFSVVYIIYYPKVSEIVFFDYRPVSSLLLSGAYSSQVHSANGTCCSRFQVRGKSEVIADPTVIDRDRAA